MLAMFRRKAGGMSSDGSSLEGGGKAGRRDEELRRRVAELQQQLETEKSMRKREHGEKVANL